jgi:P27 family predicted phage terminase small subunit
MKPGPPPKPSNLKKLSGNPGRRPLNDAEPDFPVPGRTPSPPDYLDERGAEIWLSLGRLLLDAGLLTKVDLYALGMFCSSASRWMDAEQKIKETGPVLKSKTSGNLYQNPYLHVANRSWDQMRRMFGHFGLTPAERSRLKVTVSEEEPSLADMLFKMAESDD